MKHSRRYIVFALVLAMVFTLQFHILELDTNQIGKFRGAVMAEEIWNPIIAKDVNDNGIRIVIDNKVYSGKDYNFYMNANRSVMVPVKILTETLKCSASVYNEKQLVVKKYTNYIRMPIDEFVARMNGEDVLLKSPFVSYKGEYYVSIEELAKLLGYEVTKEMKENRDRSIRIIPEMIYRAQERIIYRRDTHIDILIDKLREDKVRNVIAPILANEDGEVEQHLKEDDIQYVIDLGLIVRDKPLRIANAIYKEIIPRELTWARQQTLIQQSAWYMNPDNSINMEKLLIDFQQFFRENADSWIERFDYKESGPQLLLQAFLQRVVNGGGYIDREYGLGRGRTDLLITKPLTEQYGGPFQRIVLELKILRSNIEQTIQKGLEQTSDYIDKCGGTINEGHFILFDRRPNRSWDEKIWHRMEEYMGRKIMVWGM